MFRDIRGLEMNPDQLWETTLDPNNRLLLQVKADDDAGLTFETLMGDEVPPQKGVYRR